MTKETAMLNKEDFAWYTYSSSIGMQISSESGNNEFSLTEGSSFGMRPSEDGDTLDLVVEEVGMNVMFKVPSEIGATIAERSSEVAGEAEDSGDADDLGDE